MALPNPGGVFPLPGVDLPDVNVPGPSINPLNYVPNPFESLLNWTRDLFQNMGELFEDLIIDPPRPVPGDWQDYLYGNSLGLARELSVAVAIILVVIAMV